MAYPTFTSGQVLTATDMEEIGEYIDDLIPSAPSWFPNTGSWAPEYGTGYYRSGLYTISAPAGKTINIVQLTVTAQTNYNPAWLTVQALSGSSVSYYVYCKGYAAGYVLCHLDCRN